MKKLISLLVLLAMAVSLTIPAAAAEDASAGTMRLESAEGAVTVKNASGLDVKLQSKMRLYDGYTVKTNSASYAYISLDGAKTLKLDASSEASVSKSGKKLEITLVSGSLFFNVSKPLESSESLNIRTSTMVTGVRGTSACVSAPSRNHSEITLLTGRLEVTGRDSHSGEMETVEMSAGERVVVTQQEAGTPREHLDIQKLPAKEPELPGFAAVEVAKDPELQSRITAETELSVPLIIADAEERLAGDEAAAREKEAEVRQELEQERQDKTVDSVFQADDDDDIYGQDDDDGGGAGGSTTRPDPPAPVDPVDPDQGSITLNNPSAQKLAETMASAVGVVNVYLTDELVQDVRVKGVEKTLNLHTGTLTNGAGNMMTLRGATNTDSAFTLVNQGGTLTVTGSLSVNGLLKNDGPFFIGEEEKPCEMTVTGTYTGSGAVVLAGRSTLTMNNITDSLTITVKPRGRIEILAPGELIVSVGGTAQTLPDSGSYLYTNDSVSDVVVSMRISQDVVNLGSSSAQELQDALDAGATRTVNLIDDAAIILQAGKTLTVPQGKNLNIASGCSLTVPAGAAMTVNGTVTVEEGGRLSNYGTLSVTSMSSLHVEGLLRSRGILYVGQENGSSGLVEITDTGVLQLVMESSVEVSDGSILRITGAIELLGDTSFAIRVLHGGRVTLTDRGTHDLYVDAGGSTGPTRLTPDAGGVYDYANTTGDTVDLVLEQHVMIELTNTVSFVKVTGLNGVTSPGGTPVETGDSWDFTVPDGSIFTFQLIMEPGYKHIAFTTGGDASSDVSVQEDSATGIWTIAKRTNSAEGIIGDLTLKFVVTQDTAPVDPAATHTVTFQGANFSIEHNGSTIPAGGSAYATPGEAFTFTVTPAENYVITSVSDGANLIADAATGEYSLGVISADVTVTVGTKSTTLDLDSPDLDALTGALEDTVLETINVTNAALTVTGLSGSDFSIPAGKTLNLRSGTLSLQQNVLINGALTTDPDTTLTLSYNSAYSTYGHTTVNNGGELKIGGNLELSEADLINNGTLELSGTAQAQVNAGTTLTNHNAMVLSGSGQLTVDGGTLSNDSMLNNSGTLTLSNGGKLNNEGTLNNRGTLTVNDNGSLTVNDRPPSYAGEPALTGILNNYHTLILSDGSNLTIGGSESDPSYCGKLNNSGGTLVVSTGTLAVKNGTLNITGGTVGSDDSYNSNVVLSIMADNSGSEFVHSKVILSGGTLRVASITGPSGTEHGIFQWSGDSTIECMKDTASSSPVDSGVELTHSSTSTIVAPTSISGQTGWYAWTLTSSGS